MYRKRRSYRVLTHIKEHLENALTTKNNNMKIDVKLALALVEEAMGEEKLRNRNNEKGGETKMNILTKYLAKLVKYIPKNLGAFVGIAQTVVTFVREACMLVARLLCPIIPGEVDDIAVKKINDKAKIVLDFLEKGKNWLLGLGFKV